MVRVCQSKDGLPGTRSVREILFGTSCWLFGCNLLLNFLFQRLNGVFEVRIYPVEYNVRNILSVCKDPLDKQAWRSRVIEGVDLTKVEQIVDGIDFTEIRKRRALYSRLYHEASISHEQGLGMSFSDMLTLLAHHKLIVDADALV